MSHVFLIYLQAFSAFMRYNYSLHKVFIYVRGGGVQLLRVRVFFTLNYFEQYLCKPIFYQQDLFIACVPECFFNYM